MGTFSKALSPAVRMNYLVLPDGLLKRWNRVFAGFRNDVPWLSQAVVRALLQQGHWDRLLKRAQTRNKRKHAALTQALQKHLGRRIRIVQGGAGPEPSDRSGRQTARICRLASAQTRAGSIGRGGKRAAGRRARIARAWAVHTRARRPAADGMRSARGRGLALGLLVSRVQRGYRAEQHGPGPETVVFHSEPP